MDRKTFSLEIKRESFEVLSVFDFSGVMVAPWADAGHRCYCVDLQHRKGRSSNSNITYIGADILKWWPAKDMNIKIVFFFPPCTDLAVSGARWFKTKGLDKLIYALTLFNRSIKIAEYLGVPFMIENPVSTVSTYWRKPDYKFQPWEYGDLWYKKTCLWTGNGFVMPSPIHNVKPKGVEPLIHKMGPSKSRSNNRSNNRSKTPPGFAQAVYESNSPFRM